MNDIFFDLDIPVFFILCKGRSGSTLLQTMLNAHPEVQVPSESRIFIYAYEKYADKTDWKKKDLRQFYNDLFLNDEFREIWNVDKTKLKKALLSQSQKSSFAKLYKIVSLHYDRTKDHGPIKLLGDKNPVNCLFLDQIKTVFPRAKFIHLIRDPRDVCLSQITNFSIEPLALAAQKWCLYNQMIEKHKRQEPSAFFTVYYEELVKNPSELTQEISDFLGIEFKKDTLDTQKRQPETAHIPKNLIQNIKKIHHKVAKPIDTKSIGKWKNNLTSEQVRKIEGITGDLMESYGYARAYAGGKRATLWEKSYFRYRMFRLRGYYKSPIWIRKYYRKLLMKTSNFAFTK